MSGEFVSGRRERPRVRSRKLKVLRDRRRDRRRRCTKGDGSLWWAIGDGRDVACWICLGGYDDHARTRREEEQEG